VMILSMIQILHKGFRTGFRSVSVKEPLDLVLHPAKSSSTKKQRAISSMALQIRQRNRNTDLRRAGFCDLDSQ
jgi:hypothetical protein